MSTELTAHDRRRELLGSRLTGRFTIDPREHRAFTDAVFATDWPHDVAHPMYLHLVAHCGKGITLEEFFGLMETRLEAGVTFGQGRLEFHRPLAIGTTYDVVTEFADVVPKQGRTRGAFDVVTCRIEVRDPGGDLVGVSHESYVVPNEERDQ